MLLSGKVAVVTGGGHGIGRAIARRFSREGARVVIAELIPERGETVREEVESEGGKALFIQTDVSGRESVERMVKTTIQEWGRLDILVNNAGITGEDGHFLELSQERWDRIIAVNQTGVFLCAQAAARQMIKTGGGCMINIASVNSFVPQPRCCAYGAAKGALVSMTRSMATDLAAHRIRVNAIAPGAIQVAAPDDSPPEPNRIAMLGRNGLPGEIASSAVFLASGEAAYITGQVIIVDGGTLNNAYSIYREGI
ncbi:MAG: 3-oxoacyl-ACP reductase FabG [Planctomycetes bacterium]|nr:3-oxoacyl-ACP reductase FabG [Planctomycetota bacterium]